MIILESQDPEIRNIPWESPKQIEDTHAVCPNNSNLHAKLFEHQTFIVASAEAETIISPFGENIAHEIRSL